MLIWDIFKRYDLNITGIFHVGAHKCEERGIYAKFGFGDDKVIWLEAIPQLVEWCKNNFPETLQIHQVLVSDKCEILDFHMTNFLYSSSMFKLKLHKEEHPEVYESNVLKLQSTTLAKFIQENAVNMNNYNFLYMDIQGSELKALKGLSEFIDKVNYIYTEVSVKELYEGQVLMPELTSFLEGHNFKLAEHKLTHHGWGDALYIRSSQ